MTQGRLGEAERYSRKVLALSGPADSPGRYLSSALRLAYLELRYRNNPSRALDIVETALVRLPLDSLQEGDRPYDELARLFATVGHTARARELIRQAEQSGVGRQQRLPPNRRWSLGSIALADGRLRDALLEFNQAAETLDCPICVLPDLARGYETAGKPDSAIAVYRRYLRTPWEWRFETDAIELGWTMKRLGELYQQQSDTANAIGAYTGLLRLWRRADPGLQTELDLARRRLAGLGAATASPRSGN
jgi:tetratricopeptide (TPR) repeat protein